MMEQRLIKENDHQNDEEYRAQRKEYKDAGFKCVDFVLVEDENGEVEAAELWVRNSYAHSGENGVVA